MKRDILYALDLLIKQDELGNTNSKNLNTIIPLIDDEGSITKEQTIEMLFTQSTNPDVAYRAFVNRIKEALEVSLSSDTLSTIDKEVLESLKVEIVKKRGDSPAHIYFEAKAKRKVESYIKDNDNYRDEEYVNSRGDTGERREYKEENIRLFISYARDDKFVASIFEGIFKEFTKDTEIGYWIDDDIELGKDFDISIKEALKSCDYGLCLISQSFLDSKYITQTELTYFLDNDNILPIGLSSKIDGKPSSSFFSEVSKKYNDNQKIMDMLKKQIYTLKGIGDNIFFEKTIDQEYKDNFIKGLILEIEKKIAKKKELKREQEKYNIACYNPLFNDERYEDEKFELNHGSHISFDKEPETQEKKKNIEKVAVLDNMLEWATSSDTPPIYALLGDYGMGKTFNCRKFAYELSKLSESDNSIQRAIYIDLREIDTFIINSEGNTVIPPLESILSQILKSRGSSESVEEIISDVTDGKSIIIFDGLDEKIVHYTKEMETKFLSELMRIIPSNSNPAKMVLSCRTHHFEDIYAQNGFFRELDRGKRSDNYQAVTILPFDTVQISSFLTKVLPREDAKKAIALIESEKYLKEIVSRPYLLDKISASITSIVALQNRGEVINSASFYQTIIQDTLLRDEEKHSIPRRAKIELLQALSFKMWQEGHQILKIDELNDWLHEWIGDNPKRSIRDIVTQSSWRQLETDLRNTTLLIRFGDEDFGFSHSSMMEYFLSQYALEHWEEIAGSKEFSTLSRQFLLDSTINLKTKEKEILLPKLIQSAESSHNIYWVILSLDILSLLGLDIENLELRNNILKEYKFKNLNIKHLTIEACDLYSTQWLDSHIEMLTLKSSNLSQSYWQDSTIETLTDDDNHLKEITLYQSQLPIETIHDFSKRTYQDREVAKLSYGDSISVRSVIFSPNGEQIVSGSEDNTLKLWNTRGECLATFEGHSGTVASVCFSPNGEQIVSGSYDDTLKLWNTRGECLATFEGHSHWVSSVCFSPNGEQIVSGSYDDTLKLWNTRGECLATFEGHSHWVSSVCFSPNGEQIVSGSLDNRLKLWNTRGECLATFEGHSSIVASVCFSPNGEQIVSGSDDKTLKLWNTRGECLATFEGHSGTVTSVCFSPNGEQIVSGSYDKTLKLWNTRGECLATFEGNSDWVTSVCFSPNGEQIVSGSDDGSMIVWDIETPKELSRMYHLDSEWYSFDLENQTAKGTPMSWKLSTLSDSQGELFRIDALRGFEVYPYMNN